MKRSLIVLIIFPQIIYASMTQVKIDANWKIKYNQNEWSYLFLKPAAPISSNIFENKKDKFKLVLQKEAHIDETQSKNLIEEKCQEANKYYSNKNGSAKLELIKNTKFCFIEYKNLNGTISRQFVTPENLNSRAYDLYSYAWLSSNEQSKDQVIKFIERNLK